MSAPTLGLDELRRGSKALHDARKEARADYVHHCEAESAADREYRKTLSKAVARNRLDGMSFGEADVHARAEAANAKYRRDVAASLAKAALLRIEECERDSATLRSIGDWSQRLEHLVA